LKKLVTSAFTIVLLLGIGTGVYAASDKIACKVGDFKEMLPHMQEKHPELSDKQLKEMHKDCVAKMKKETNIDCMITK
jgi:uncharacterized short protein YbdD (DUF466 family)